MSLYITVDLRREKQVKWFDSFVREGEHLQAWDRTSVTWTSTRTLKFCWGCDFCRSIEMKTKVQWREAARDHGKCCLHVLTCLVGVEENTRILWNAQKTHRFSYSVHCCSSVSAPVSLSPAPPKYLVCSDWPAHARLSPHHAACLWSALSCFQLPVSFTPTSFTPHKHSVMSQSHSGTTDDAFRSSVLCGRDECLLVQTLTFLPLKIFYMYKKIYKTQKGKKNTNLITSHMDHGNAG